MKMVLDSRQVLLVYCVAVTTDVWFCYSFHSCEVLGYHGVWHLNDNQILLFMQPHTLSTLVRC